MIDRPDLVELGLVVRVLDTGLWADRGRSGDGAARLVRPRHALRDQHVVQPGIVTGRSYCNNNRHIFNSNSDFCATLYCLYRQYLPKP